MTNKNLESLVELIKTLGKEDRAYLGKSTGISSLAQEQKTRKCPILVHLKTPGYIEILQNNQEERIVACPFSQPENDNACTYRIDSNSSPYNFLLKPFTTLINKFRRRKPPTRCFYSESN